MHHEFVTYTDAALQELKVCSAILMGPHIVCHGRRVTQQFVGLPSRLRRLSCAGSTTGWQRCSHQCHRGDNRRSEERLFPSRATASHTKKSLAENRFRLHGVCVCVWLIKGWVRLYSSSPFAHACCSHGQWARSWKIFSHCEGAFTKISAQRNVPEPNQPRQPRR